MNPTDILAGLFGREYGHITRPPPEQDTKQKNADTLMIRMEFEPTTVQASERHKTRN
jgi:hypothetical protein